MADEKIVKKKINVEEITNTYVRYFLPGILVSEPIDEKVSHRDPAKIRLPKSAFGFQFYDGTEMISGGEVLNEKETNHSGKYYFGNVRTIADVAREEPESILYINMKCNKIDRVVETIFGQCFPLNKEDVVLPESERKIKYGKKGSSKKN